MRRFRLAKSASRRRRADPPPVESAVAPAAPAGGAASVRLTVALCTRERPEHLARALASLARQEETPHEVLVIDNAPDERGHAPTADVVRGFPSVRLVREVVSGLDVARNRALREATGDVVAFLDDDAVAETGWTRALVEAFAADAGLGVCTGRVEALETVSDGARLFEANGGFGRGATPIVLPHDARGRLHGRRAPLIAWAVSVGCGCSFAVRRDLALSIGGFDPLLDRGAPLPGGGDHDLLWRVLEAGWRVRYEPHALAWHAHRATVPDVVRQIAGHQKALVAFLVKSARRARSRALRRDVTLFLLWRLVKPAARLVRRLLGRDPLPAGAILRVWGSALRGLVAYR